MIFLFIYVDDILLIDSDQKDITIILHLFNSKFPIQDLGNAHYFLGIELFSNFKGHLLSHRKYIIEILQQIKMDGVYLISILIIIGNFFTPRVIFSYYN